jgi:hypothetical protein
MKLFALAAVVASPKTPSSVILSNIAYLVGAVVVACAVIIIVVLRHRRPVSTEENMDTFHRGLAALAPGQAPRGRRRSGSSSRQAGVPQPQRYREDAGPRTRVRNVPARTDGSLPRRPKTGS